MAVSVVLTLTLHSHVKTEEMGEFFIKHGENFKVVCILMEDEYTATKKMGLTVEGIEMRPKD